MDYEMIRDELQKIYLKTKTYKEQFSKKALVRKSFQEIHSAIGTLMNAVESEIVYDVELEPDNTEYQENQDFAHDADEPTDIMSMSSIWEGE